MGNSNSRIRAVTGLVNARANLAAAEARQAQIALEERRFADATSQRDRFVSVIAEAATEHVVAVFEYQQILSASSPTATRPKGFDQ